MQSTPKTKPRNLKARPQISITPLVVTNLNCMQVVGIDARRFRERILPKCAGRFRSGAIAGAPADEVLEALRTLAVDGDQDVGEDGGVEDDDVDQPRDEGAVLARIGLRKAAPR